MDVLHYTGAEEQREELEAVISRYKTQCNTCRISPELVLNITPDIFTGLVIASEPEQDDLIRGVILYDIFTIGGLDYFERKLRATDLSIIDAKLHPASSPLKSLDLFKNQPPDNTLAYITSMETFDHREGIGTALLTQLKEQPWIAGIFLQSLSCSKGFYRRRDFSEIGLYCGSKNSPYMIWFKE